LIAISVISAMNLVTSESDQFLVQQTGIRNDAKLEETSISCLS